MPYTIFGWWELAVADDDYIRNGSGSNIDTKTFKVRRRTILMAIGKYLSKFEIKPFDYTYITCPGSLIFLV